jgi:predicted ATPase with chaperone activity
VPRADVDEVMTMAVAEGAAAISGMRAQLERIWPRGPKTVAECSLPPSFLEDLTLKTIHYGGPATLEHLARRMGLVQSMVEEITDGLRGAGALETVSVPQSASHAFSAHAFRFALTGRGEQRVAEALARSRYGGVAPVTLPEYVAMARVQSLRRMPSRPADIAESLASFVLKPAVLRSLARAFHSGRPALLYGDSGNGKTAMIEAFTRSFGETVLMPSAIHANGQIVRIYDPSVHRRVDLRQGTSMSQENSILKHESDQIDRRWLTVRRPVVTVAGELTLNSLELRYDEVGGFYIAPPHLKAQDGIFVVDDFGRQQIQPEDLLNRWILPLERGTDLLTLSSGEQLTFPFEISVLFSTNMNPAALADEAFLRRIPYKVHVTGPGPAELAEITRRECVRRGWPVDEAGVQELVRAVFAYGAERARGVFPRDLLGIIEDGARFAGTPPVLTAAAIAEACAVYFLEPDQL